MKEYTLDDCPNDNFIPYTIEQYHKDMLILMDQRNKNVRNNNQSSEATSGTVETVKEQKEE